MDSLKRLSVHSGDSSSTRKSVSSSTQSRPNQRSQNYFRPEISCINRISDYLNRPSILNDINGEGSGTLANIKEEEHKSSRCSSKGVSRRESGKKNEKPLNAPLEELKEEETRSEENNEYLGLFDIIMKELADFPKSVQEKIRFSPENLFEIKLKEIRKRAVKGKGKGKRKRVEKKAQQKINVCTFNCHLHSLQNLAEDSERLV